MPQVKQEPVANAVPASLCLTERDDADQEAVVEASGASPVLALQESLANRLASPDLPSGADADDGGRWSPRAALALASGVSLLLWAAVAYLVSVLR